MATDTCFSATMITMQKQTVWHRRKYRAIASFRLLLCSAMLGGFSYSPVPMFLVDTRDKSKTEHMRKHPVWSMNGARRLDHCLSHDLLQIYVVNWGRSLPESLTSHHTCAGTQVPHQLHAGNCRMCKELNRPTIHLMAALWNNGRRLVGLFTGPGSYTC